MPGGPPTRYEILLPPTGRKLALCRVCGPRRVGGPMRRPVRVPGSCRTWWLVVYRAYLRDRGLSSWPRSLLGARCQHEAVFHPSAWATIDRPLAQGKLAGSPDAGNLWPTGGWLRRGAAHIPFPARATAGRLARAYSASPHPLVVDPRSFGGLEPAKAGSSRREAGWSTTTVRSEPLKQSS